MPKYTTIIYLIAFVGLFSCTQTVSNVYDKNYTLKLSRDTVIFNVGGGQKSVEIKTNQEWWEYTDNNNDANWYTVKDFHNADGYDMLTISTDSITELANREAFLTINAGNKYSTQLCIIQLGNNPYIQMNYDSITIDMDTAILNLAYVSNIDFDIENTADWISFSNKKTLKEDTLDIYIQKNKSAEKRSATILFKQKNGDYSRALHITQLAELNPYSPVDPESIKGNKQIPVVSASASSVADNSNLDYLFDGNIESYFQTDWQESEALEFNLKIDAGNDLLNYIIYYPSIEANTQSVKIAQVMTRKVGEETFNNLKMVVFDQNNPIVIEPSSPLANIEEVKFKIMSTFVQSGTIPAASCAEVEFYTTSVLYSNIFTDITCSELLPEVSMDDILNIDNIFYRNIAKHLHNGTYQMARIQQLEAIQQDRINSKINNASLYEYATGIYLNTDEEVVVFCGEFTGKSPSLMVLNSFGKEEYSLMQGINKLTIKDGGNVYINNPTELKIHIAGGEVKGSIGIENIDEIQAVEPAEYQLVDIYGAQTHVISPVSFVKKNVDKIKDFNSNIEQIINAAQVFYGVNDGTYKANSKLTFYIGAEGLELETSISINEEELDAICSFNGEYSTQVFSVLEKIGNAYEPYLNKLWGINGVSSKLFALSYFYENYGISIIKNNDYYASAIQDIIVSNINYTNAESEWSRAVPLWQLYHYLKEAHDINDYYAQMCNMVKEKNSLGTYTGELLGYTKQVSGINFNDFFYKWNMGGSQSAEPITGGLAYYNEDNLSVYQNMGELTPGRFYTSMGLLVSYKNMIAIEIYNAGFLAHVETYKDGTSYKITWDKYSPNMKIKVVGANGESLEPIYY